MRQAVVRIMEELHQAHQTDWMHPAGRKPLWVLGVSTSEVQGARIGQSGSEQVAAEIFAAAEEVARRHSFWVAYQCCEHLNRALVLPREAAVAYQYPPVQVVPVPEAGGSMAAYAYRHLPEPVVVEKVEAEAAIDIGDTLVGMHLRRVAVPFRPSVRQVGQAHVTAAWTRHPLIGGRRAQYP